MAAHGAAELIGGECLRGTELAGEALLLRVACPDEHRRRRGAVARAGQVIESRRHQQADRACPDDGHHVTVGDRRTEHRVHRAGHGLDRHRIGVAQRVGHRVELAGMRHQARGRPTASGVGAEARLQARANVAECDVAAVAHVPGLAGRAHGLYPAGRAAEHRLQHDPAAGGQHPPFGTQRVLGERAHHLMSGHKRKGDDVLEIARAAPVQRRQVGPADPRQDGVDVHPVRGRHRRRVALYQA